MARALHCVGLLVGTLAMTACGGGNDSVVATPSTQDITVVTGASQILSITFTSSDGLALSNLALTTNLRTLPAGWNGPEEFGCASVNTGSGCVLNLTFAPRAAVAGSLSLGYTYLDDAGALKAGSVSVNYAATAQNNVIASALPSGEVTATVGAGTQSLTVTFTTDDGNPASDLTLTSNLAALPGGWGSANSTFSCASVNIGNGCQLTLTFQPTSAGRGALALNYAYHDDSGGPKTGSLIVPYTATIHDSVVATPSPSGAVVASVGGGIQPVTVTFTTDDGNSATGLLLTSDLAELPTGWSSTAGQFTCAHVASGTGCQLTLSFAPVAATTGSLTLQYAYTDDAGSSKSGSMTLPYAGTTHDNVIATLSPQSPIGATVGASQGVSVTFTTDDGNTASSFSITSGLGTLPSGWSSAGGSFACASVAAGSGCRLALSYAPSAVTVGTLSLGYGYEDDSGATKTGTVSIAYSATVSDVVVATASPSAASAITGSSEPVVITFVTNDGNPASSLNLTSNLASLPSGWTTSGSTFSCTTVSAGSACQLPLLFNPATAGNGTLSLTYDYVDDSGTARTGSVSVPYAATANDSVVATASPSTAVVTVGGSLSVAIDFATNDGNPASSLNVTSSLASLPSGWTSAGSTFTCATVSAGTVCRLPLTFAPFTTGSGTLTLDYSYFNDAGMPLTGSVTIPYASTQPYLYATNFSSNSVSVCPINGNGSLGACAATGSGLQNPQGIAFKGNYVYIANSNGSSVTTCSVNSDGSFSGCSNASFAWPGDLTANPLFPYAYVQTNGALEVCGAGAGPLTSCAVTGSSLSQLAFSASGTQAYGTVSTYNGHGFTTSIELCVVQPSGALGSCTATGSNTNSAAAAQGVYGDHLYLLAGSGLLVCPIANDGTLGACVVTGSGTTQGAAFMGGLAYINLYPSTVEVCPINSDGTLGNCTLDSDPSFNVIRSVVIH